MGMAIFPAAWLALASVLGAAALAAEPAPAADLKLRLLDERSLRLERLSRPNLKLSESAAGAVSPPQTPRVPAPFRVLAAFARPVKVAEVGPLRVKLALGGP